MKPLVIDLFSGLGGFTEGFLAEGYECVGYDIERHDYGNGGYPGQLVLQDVLTIDGARFKDAAVIVCSPPCQEYSYMAMPFSRGKKIAEEYRTGVRDKAKLTALFDACFRIQREASAAAGHKIPMVVENVKGAQKWVGRAKWHFGSYYLWGDVPALMPWADGRKSQHDPLTTTPDGTGKTSWFFGNSKHEGRFYGQHVSGYKTSGMNWSNRKLRGQDFTRIAGKQVDDTFGWSKDSPLRNNLSHSNARKAASAMIAKIPLPLSQHLARVFHP